MKTRSGRATGFAGVRVGGLASALALALAVPVSGTGDGVVRAVLFSSPTCPHCQKVREEVLPELGARFKGQLQVAVLSTSTSTGRDLYWSAFQRYGVQQRGVPLLVVGDFALVGSLEIPQRLPTLVDSYLEQGGVDWPPLPGLAAVLAASAPTPTPAPNPAPEAPVVATTVAPPAPAGLEPRPAPEPTPVSRTPGAGEPPTVAESAAASRSDAHARGSEPPAPLTSPDRSASDTHATASSPAAAPPAASPALLAIDGGHEPPGTLDRLRADPRGNGLALLVLVGMVAAVLRSFVVLRRPGPATWTKGFDWLPPLLALAGLGVAAYLAHVEVRQIEAVCGPVGDCNTVQQSAYARLFGVIPIGVLGVLGFAAVLVAWGVRRHATGRASSWAGITLLVMTGLGTLFSIYLTFLEPFVIGASCLWCLSSAVIMTVLFGLAHTPGRAAAAEIRRRPSYRPSPCSAATTSTGRSRTATTCR